MELIVILISVLLFIIYGVIEQRNHQKNIDSIKIRVNVNGIRGKSTVTRLITGIVKEASYKTMGKTTGTSARIIYWNQKEEEPIIRRKEGPNIGEQRKVVAKAAHMGVEALISECMAVNPDYQITYQEKMVQANIGVIVNVLEDHMDVMGPTLDEVAEAFIATIPHNGYLVTIESPYLEYFKQVARERGTEVIVADNDRITDAYLREFDYMVFPDNAALALGVAKALDIPEDIAFRGMLNAHPDPGAMKIKKFGQPGAVSYFVNGFAANDASSTLRIWERVGEIGYPVENPIVIMNCRPDRVDRTEQFAKDVLPYIPCAILVLIGETTSPIVKAYNDGLIPAEKLMNLENQTTEEIYSQLMPQIPNRMIYGVGNIHGAAEPLIEEIEEIKFVEKAS
ncbi:poly-gamma-glutamate synthase PgsB [Bacillus massiliigorillae]|uniref:poly-gamma-glutamate synthase PgsB n=1 Tax=Bacillus massiliigorillae TaxID=1243664 RepID=UPI0003AA247B|nr:poly-gamma-glutamate synthase PgsB [Bacillus massiliigorillae]